jgi:hypothetical protein
MTDTDVDVPQVGPVNKRIVVGVVVGVGGFVGYRYWQAKKTATATDSAAATDTTNPDFTNTNSDPSAVLGAVSPTNSFGDSSTGTTTPIADSSSYGFNGTTNDQWTQYAASQLAQADQWSYADIVTALGLYLEEMPTTPMQQQIVSSAVAVAGYPPVGHHVLISTPVTTTPPVAAPPATSTSGGPVGVPGKATVSNITKTSATFTWPAVPNAVGYIVNTDAKTYKVTGTSKTVADYKTPGKRYNVQIQAVASDGSVSAKSVNTSFTTKK